MLSNWTSIIWLMSAGVCITLAAVHLLLWLRDRNATASLAFSLWTTAVASAALLELAMMHSPTPEDFSAVLGAAAFPYALTAVGYFMFIRLYLRAGRLWLMWAVFVMVVLELLIKVAVVPTFPFAEITELKEIQIWGDTLVAPVGVKSTWSWVTGLLVMLEFAFVGSAVVEAWRGGRTRQVKIVALAVCSSTTIAIALILLVMHYEKPPPLATIPPSLFTILVMVYGLSSDFLGARQLKEAKKLAESANRAKSLFLANMSHELRTPLNAILGFSEMLAREQENSADQKEKLAIINRSGRHLLSMINDVLDLSKIEAGGIEVKEAPVDLVALIEESCAMIRSRAAAKGIAVEVKTESISFPHVKTDVGKLRQILINLLSNAVKFTDQGGVIIRCATESVSGERQRCRIVIEVEDTGPGIDQARHSQIFEPFVQGEVGDEREGTGLGLSICKKFAETMGGTMKLESQVGKGSLFRVRLPAWISEAEAAKLFHKDTQRVIGLAPKQPDRRILVADDNEANLLLLQSLLNQAGFITVEARNGEEVVALFKKQSFDLIWMDMRMPVMDGYETTRAIRMLPDGDTVKIAAITASAFAEERAEILAAGCDDVVHKPFTASEIFETMNRLLGVAYLYEKDDIEKMRQKPPTLTADMLADLPDSLMEQLRQTTLALNRDAALQVISRLGDTAPEVAAGLRGLVDNFQMAELRNVLEEVNDHVERT